jgi:hypothetical protein
MMASTEVSRTQRHRRHREAEAVQANPPVGTSSV